MTSCIQQQGSSFTATGISKWRLYRAYFDELASCGFGALCLIWKLTGLQSASERVFCVLHTSIYCGHPFVDVNTELEVNKECKKGNKKQMMLPVNRAASLRFACTSS